MSTRPDRSSSGLDLVLRATLLTLLLTGFGGFPIALLLQALCVIGLLMPRAGRRPALWWSCAALLAVFLIGDWPNPDNHIYGLAYWCVALALATGSDEPERVAAQSARWLLFLIFGLSLVWKVVVSPDFVDGTFFQVMLVSDPRFVDLAVLLGQLDASGGTSATRIATQLAAPAHSSLGGLVLPGSGAVLNLALLLTAATVILEAWIAMALLAPVSSRIGRSVLIALGLFVVTTYAIAPVEGFGYLLVCMAMALVEPLRRGTRVALVALFATVLIHHWMPWAEIAFAIRSGS